MYFSAKAMGSIPGQKRKRKEEREGGRGGQREGVTQKHSLSEYLTGERHVMERRVPGNNDDIGHCDSTAAEGVFTVVSPERNGQGQLNRPTDQVKTGCLYHLSRLQVLRLPVVGGLATGANG